MPVEIRINQSQLPAESDRGLESYFVRLQHTRHDAKHQADPPLSDALQMQVPRTAYLPFLVADIRAHLAELVLNEREVGNIKEENWWFEDEYKGVIKAYVG